MSHRCVRELTDVCSLEFIDETPSEGCRKVVVKYANRNNII
jgi:hypothetical protein